MSDNKPTIIGDFDSVPNNAPRSAPEPRPVVRREPRKAEPPKAEEEPAVTQEEVAEVMRKVAETQDKPLTPEEKAKIYMEGLTAVGLSIEDAREIMAIVLEDGGYEEEVFIGANGRCPVVLRTREYIDTQRMLRLVESEAPQIPTHYNDILARCNVAASLVRYNNTTFSRPVREGMIRKDYQQAVEDAFHERLDFITALPTPVVTRLMTLVGDFDRKVFAVFAEGAPSDF